jgi:hypothetical protein
MQIAQALDVTESQVYAVRAWLSKRLGGQQ